MKKKKSVLFMYVALIIFECISIDVIKDIYKKKIVSADSVNSITLDAIVKVEKTDKNDDKVQNNSYYIRTDGNYYICTIKMTNHSLEDTYVPIINASCSDDDYLTTEEVEYYDNTFKLSNYSYNDRIPALTTVEKEYIIYYEDELPDLTVSLYDYDADYLISPVSTVFEQP